MTGLSGAVSAVETGESLLSTQAFCVLARRQRTASNNLKLQLLSFIVIYICVPSTTTTHHINFVVYYYLPPGEEY